MANISSNSLFHFTSTFLNLARILTENFTPRYCVEEIKFGTECFELAIPMVCFCDIPLSQIKNHQDVYGNYGIGMTKEWAQKKGINPVFYLRKESLVDKKLQIFWDKLNFKPDRSEDALNSMDFAFELLRYLKMYEGFFKRINKDHIYYNEREWRYVPLNSKEYFLFLTKSIHENEAKLRNMNFRISKHKLVFNHSDIAHIIINDQSERLRMIDKLRELYSNSNLEILISKIKTTEDINQDY
ncbi:hypothetical protein G9H64_09700 [Aquirufa nivalisilvae]|uniref:abortive infection system antitoxin AbiGi family protein n=1 Tax=Aquirufa nivalisilvae TaxID=2516557 RepID=UPI0022A96991|nr:abortive infection system antitoxin AbiGi family protein [Aquirufa nivalisilvae]MCZ2483231.1 hypothetical protein [Aquirufa nivalisilvae]